ncbi:glycosyltransferase family 9 protein [Panacibacter sp. DH6]|uniref:Glycosyltransferase family 9 protein n=1 Tax=Panacibacter microcysteis TaxID=2793269 RepID=A0A931E240_9BACT|nr:glycosyltransferase family 9 protein [Panacibacter microcysteis]MBG9374717.1 glycosyltransferase family 9 protein [Panacibacter microcysteis]
MKILVIRFSSIGDIVLASPVMRCLKKQLNAEVHFLTKQGMKAVTEHNPYIDKFFYFDNNLAQLKQQLKAEQYDYVVDLHKNFRTFSIKLALRTKTLTYKKETLRKFLLTKLHINVMMDKHITQRSLDTVAPLGVKDDGKGLDYFIGEKDVLPLEAIPLTHRFGYVALVIGGSYFTKKLPVEKLQQLCNKINHPIILVGGKEDIWEAEQIEKVDAIKIYNACGKFNLNQSADLVKKAKLVISHDTGLQYIACAFNRPVLAIWGGTSPELDVEPYYGKDTQQAVKFTYENFVVKGLSCQPCSNYGLKKCPRSHFKCMQLQDMDRITAATEKILW